MNEREREREGIKRDMKSIAEKRVRKKRRKEKRRDV